MLKQIEKYTPLDHFHLLLEHLGLDRYSDVGANNVNRKFTIDSVLFSIRLYIDIEYC